MTTSYDRITDLEFEVIVAPNITVVVFGDSTTVFAGYTPASDAGQHVARMVYEETTFSVFETTVINGRLVCEPTEVHEDFASGYVHRHHRQVNGL